MYKNCKVVMLPTNEKAPIKLGLNDLMVFDNYKNSAVCNRNDDFINQHLYIASDDKIKKGDWCMKSYGIPGTEEVVKYIPEYGNQCKKIIATTNKSLRKVEDFILNTKKLSFELPQPSQTFIEKYIEEYNKSNIITDVLVEYQERQEFENADDYDYGCGVELKVNSDNTITIRKVKDSWTREEVVELLYKHTEDMFKEKITLDKWIKENL